jgi:hypothetical protein
VTARPFHWIPQIDQACAKLGQAGQVANVAVRLIEGSPRSFAEHWQVPSGHRHCTVQLDGVPEFETEPNVEQPPAPSDGLTPPLPSPLRQE